MTAKLITNEDFELFLDDTYHHEYGTKLKLKHRKLFMHLYKLWRRGIVKVSKEIDFESKYVKPRLEMGLWKD